MIQKTTVSAVCAAALLPFVAFGFESDSYSLARSFSKTAVLTNSQITVTVNFTNAGTATCRGFYYSDQVPSGLTVSTVSLRSKGRQVTNYLLESGQDGDVYPGCTPYRWVLEQPTNFAQANPVQPQYPVQLVYTITSAASNVFNLQQFTWVGFEPTPSNVVFGYSENTDQQCVVFTTPAVIVSVQSATNGILVGLNGLPGTNYVLEAATNFSNWIPLVTNAAPFQFTDTNLAVGHPRFYRGRLF